MFPNVRVIGADETTTTAAAANALQVVTVKAKLFTVSAFNNTAGDLYLQAHDSAGTPSEGAVPKLTTTAYAGMSGGFGFTDGAIFKNGIYICFSDLAIEKQLAAAGTGLIDATFRRI